MKGVNGGNGVNMKNSGKIGNWPNKGREGLQQSFANTKSGANPVLALTKIKSAGFVCIISISTLSIVYLLYIYSSAARQRAGVLQGKTVFNIIGILNIKVAPRWTEATPARLHQTSAGGSF